MVSSHLYHFYGASNIAQRGGFAALEEAGWTQTTQQTRFYLENAEMIKRALGKLHLKVYGGTNSPYLWAQFKNRKSWDVFQEILEKYHIVTTPGAGFGPSGESFVRFSAFGSRENVILATERMQKFLNG